MSLITLRSQNDSLSGSVVESSAYIRNYFKESIEFNPGDTFELVSISITKTDKFEIVTGQNDRFIWRIGQGPKTLADRSPTFSQHLVIIPEGSYNGQQLALIIQNEINRGVILQNYAPPLDNDVTQGGFQVIYSENTTVSPPTPASFQITYRQAPTPPQNGDTLLITERIELAPGILQTIQDTGINKGWLLRTDPSQFQNARDLSTLVNGVYGNKSTFPNGGEVSVDITPSFVLTSLTFNGTNKIINFDNGDGSGQRDIDVSVTSPALPNSWQYEMDFVEGVVGELIDNNSIELYNGGISGQIRQAVLSTFGTGYVVGETGPFNSGGATYEITGVSGSGAITTFNIVTPGSGYSVGDIVGFSPPAGGGTFGSIEVVQLITGGGQGYQVGDIGTITSSTGQQVNIQVDSIGAYDEILTFSLANPNAKGSGFIVGNIVNLDIVPPVQELANFEIKTVTTGITKKYGVLTNDGFLGISLINTQDATIEANWTGGKWTFNTTTNKFQNQTGTASATNNHGIIETSAGLGFPKTVSPGIYNRVCFGLARNILISGIDLYPANAVAQLQPEKGGFDIQFSIYDDNANNDIQIECTGFKKTQGASYPNANWKTTKEYILLTDNVKSNNWNTNLGTNPANWTTFNYGVDHIRVRMERYDVDKNRVLISHDNAGDQAFTEEVTVLNQGTAGSPGGLDFTPTTIENQYPFHPVVFTSKGTRFGNNDVKLRGIYDPRIIDGTDANIVSTTFNGNLRNKKNIEQMVKDEDSHFTDYTLTGLPHLNVATPLQQSSMWKWGIVDESETNGDNTSTYNAQGEGGPEIQDAQGVNTQLSGRSLSPNNQANATGLLGFERWNTYETGLTQTIKTSPNNTPSTNLLEPSLMVEFPDFNIKSYSGESSDSCKAISVIPREQWTTDQKTGTLMYVSNYPIPIDLNISNKQQLNQLTCRLRQMDGTMADDLLHPTELTIRKRRGFNPNL